MDIDPGDDPAFKNLSNRRGLSFNRLSYQCCSLDCNHCDGRIHYNIRRFKFREFDARTGETKDVYEDYSWDTNHVQVQLEGGLLQDRNNTPEGSKCECFCHRPKTSFIRRQNIVSEGKKLHELLTEEDKISLK